MAICENEGGGLSPTTQEKILRAAMKVFSERGFTEATTRAICAEARVNLALVNYYYRTKADLYRTVLAVLAKQVVNPIVAIPDGAHDAESWRSAVRAWVSRVLAVCVATDTPERYVSQLVRRAPNVPADLAREIEFAFFLPLRQSFSRLVRMAIPDASPVQIGQWCGAVHAQLIVYVIATPNWVSRFCPSGVDLDQWLEATVDHICQGVFAHLSFLEVVP